MKHILLGFIAVLSLMLVPLILMHKGKGGGFSNFAESLTGSAGSSGVAENGSVTVRRVEGKPSRRTQS